MKFIFFLIFLLSPIFSYAGSYQDCIDSVVKSAKFKEALKRGEENCFDKFIQPEFDKRYQNAASKKYVKSSSADGIALVCKTVDPGQTYEYLSCEIPDKTNQIYSIKLKVNLQNGSKREIELKNSIARDPRDETYKWEDALSYGTFNLPSKIIGIDRSSLEIKWVN